MSAYIVFTREETLDQAELEIYWQKVAATFAGHTVKLLAAYGRHEVLEGADTEGVVIAELREKKCLRRKSLSKTNMN